MYLWSPKERKVQFLSRISLADVQCIWQLFSLLYLLSVVMNWCAPSCFSQEWEALYPRWDRCWVLHSVEPKLLLQCREERGTHPAEGFTWMHSYLISWGCCLRELSGASYSECRGTASSWSAYKDKEMAPWAGLGSTTEANRVVSKENNTECSQPALPDPLLLFCGGQRDGTWGWWVRGREKGVSFPSCSLQCLPGANAMELGGYKHC